MMVLLVHQVGLLHHKVRELRVHAQRFSRLVPLEDYHAFSILEDDARLCAFEVSLVEASPEGRLRERNDMSASFVIVISFVEVGVKENSFVDGV